MEFKVDSLTFSFPSRYDVIKYDDDCISFKKLSSAFQMACECVDCPSHSCKKEKCRNYPVCILRQKSTGLKGVDLIARDDNTLYVIESKDYRTVQEPPIQHIVMEVAKKFRDTLFGVWCGSLIEDKDKLRSFLDLSRRKKLKIKFIFHFESPSASYSSGFFRKAKTPLASAKTVSLLVILEKLKQKMGPMGEYVFVTDMDSLQQQPQIFDWQVKEIQ